MSGDDQNFVPHQKYPSGPCHRYEGAVDPHVLNELQQIADNRHLLQGAYTLDPLPIACIRVSDEKQFRKFKQQITGMMSCVWPTDFGRVTGFSPDASSLGNKNVERAHIFLPTDESFANTVYSQGRLVFFITYHGKRTELYEVIFAEGQQGGGTDLSFVNAHNTLPIFYHDNELAFWRLISLYNFELESFVTPADRLSINWAKGANSFFSRWQREISEVAWGTEDQPTLELAKIEDMALFKEKFPYAYSLIEAIAQPHPSFDSVLGLMKRVLTDEYCLEEMISWRLKMPGREVALPDEVFMLFDQFFVGLQLTTEATKSGTRRLWIDALQQPIQLRYLELDRIKLGQTSPRYWYELEQFSYPFDLGRFITPQDAPVPAVPLGQSMENMDLDASLDQAVATFD